MRRGTRHTFNRGRLNLPAVAALVVCVLLTVWALSGLMSGRGHGAAADLGPEPGAGAAVAMAADPAPVVLPVPAGGTLSGPAPEAAAGAAVPLPRPQARAAGVEQLAAAVADQEALAPVRVSVPAVGLVAEVDAVGVREDGQMEVPGDAARAGWYRFGPAPGSPGSAVIAGHVDDRWGGAGSLAALHEAEPGDEVVVVHADGRETAYRIESRRSVEKASLDVAELFEREGAPRLVLVTCTGPWLVGEGHHRDNLVVVATPSGG